MASVVIAGDVSGTCTLQAANAAGTTVLSLPTTSGTLVATGGSPTFTTINATNVIASANSNAAVFTSGLGNASAPAYSFTGDTNTGIFSPTADTIAFTEGGTESMRIDSSGNVGIGTSSPATKLDVSSSSASGANVSLTKTNSGTANQNGQLINFLNYGPAATGRNAGTTIGGLYFGCSQPSSGAIQDAAAISCVAESQSGNNTASALAFSTNTGNSGNVERARIDSNGLFQFNSGYGSVATAYGCRAWVNFNGTGTVAIRASGNVSSISDNGTGDYTINFSITFPDINYCAQLTGQRDANGNGSAMAAIYGNSTYSNSVSTTSVRVQLTNDAGNPNDPISYHAAIFR